MLFRCSYQGIALVVPRFYVLFGLPTRELGLLRAGATWSWRMSIELRLAEWQVSRNGADWGDRLECGILEAGHIGCGLLDAVRDLNGVKEESSRFFGV